MINLETAQRLAAEIVAEAGPDFKYRENPVPVGRGCFYQPLPALRAFNRWSQAPIEGDVREVTGCLVGRILDAAGETCHRERSVSELDGVVDLAANFPDAFDKDGVVEYLAGLQFSQDQGETWGKALEKGAEWLRDFKVY